MMHPARSPKNSAKKSVAKLIAASLLLFGLALASAQSAASPHVQVTVLDENGVVVPDARITITQPNQLAVELLTNPAGRAQFSLATLAPYQLQADKQGFYQTLQRNVDPNLADIELILAHQQIVRQQIDVVASMPTIDPQQTADASIMSTPEIVNIPYQTSRNILNLLPFNPSVIQDPTGQAHIAGSPTYATLDLLDGFDLRSPARTPTSAPTFRTTGNFTTVSPSSPACASTGTRSSAGRSTLRA
jgi:hypothetical protein